MASTLSSLKPVVSVFSNRVSPNELQAGDHIYSWRMAYSYAHHGIYVGGGKVIHFTRGEGQELGTGVPILDGMIATSSAATHLRPCANCGLSRGSSGVLLSCLDCFLAGCPLYRFKYEENTALFLAKLRGGTCSLAVSDPPVTVLHRAHYLLRYGFGCYHIFRNNCEDFAMYCKTGLIVLQPDTNFSKKNIIPTVVNQLGNFASSGQAVSALGAPVAAALSSPLAIMLSEPWGLLVASAGIYCASRYAGDLSKRPDAVKVPVEELVARFRSVAASTPAAAPTLTAATTASTARTNGFNFNSFSFK